MLSNVLQTFVPHRIWFGASLITYKFETIALHEDKSLFGSQARLAHHHLSRVQYITGHLPLGSGQGYYDPDVHLSSLFRPEKYMSGH
uniref:Uncharacterized protein n=1 Tax=Salix viminalis TaxID=40686 RepID=A0A6N2M111_SALVM